MNTLIADSGATKTDWVLTGREGRQFVRTEGLNPHLVSVQDFVHTLQRELKPNLMGRAVGLIHFYGAGCGDDMKKEIVEKCLQEVFEFADIKVGTDLDGAGKALFGDQPGLVGILGTGSSAGYYDGEKVIKQMPSRGYPHGDEGSGSDIGKRIMISYLQEDLPEEIQQSLKETFGTGLSLENLFHLFQQAGTTKEFLGRAGRCAGDHRESPFIQQVLRDGFEAYARKVSAFYTEKECRSVGMIGSVACIYEKEMREVFSRYKIEVKKVIRSPINNLAELYNS